MAIISIIHVIGEGLLDWFVFEFARIKNSIVYKMKSFLIYHNEWNLYKFFHKFQNHHIVQSLQYNDFDHQDIYKYTKRIENEFYLEFYLIK